MIENKGTIMYIVYKHIEKKNTLHVIVLLPIFLVYLIMYITINITIFAIMC